MKKIVLALTALFLITGCENISGTFAVHESVTLKTKNGQEALVPGNYEAKVKISSKKKIVLKVDGEKFNFSIPEGRSLPTRNGRIRLSAAEVNQPYDVDGSIRTTSEDSETRRDYESCTYRVTVRHCRTDSQGRTHCWVDYVTRHGSRFVEYRLRTTTKEFRIDLINPGEVSSPAGFDGSERFAERIYSHVGQCR